MLLRQATSGRNGELFGGVRDSGWALYTGFAWHVVTSQPDEAKTKSLQVYQIILIALRADQAASWHSSTRAFHTYVCTHRAWCQYTTQRGCAFVLNHLQTWRVSRTAQASGSYWADQNSTTFSRSESHFPWPKLRRAAIFTSMWKIEVFFPVCYKNKMVLWKSEKVAECQKFAKKKIKFSWLFHDRSHFPCLFQAWNKKCQIAWFVNVFNDPDLLWLQVTLLSSTPTDSV